MNDAPLLNGDPCVACDCRRVEEDGEYCVATPDGAFDCAVLADLQTMEHVAREVAQHLHRICDRTLRREVVERTAEGFSDACCLQGRGIAFDEAAFCEMAGVPREAGA